MKKGISLIVLVITIIIIVILAGAVILSLGQNNVIENSTEAKFKSDVKTFENELLMWIATEYLNANGNLNLSQINADNLDVKYNGKTISDIIPSLKREYFSKFKINEGKLLYTGTEEKEKEWIEELNTPNLITNIENLNLVSLKTTMMSGFQLPLTPENFDGNILEYYSSTSKTTKIKVIATLSDTENNTLEVAGMSATSGVAIAINVTAGINNPIKVIVKSNSTGKTKIYTINMTVSN